MISERIGAAASEGEALRIADENGPPNSAGHFKGTQA